MIEPEFHGFFQGHFVRVNKNRESERERAKEGERKASKRKREAIWAQSISESVIIVQPRGTAVFSGRSSE